MLSIIFPVYNEADNLAPLIAITRETLTELAQHFELLFINDCSTDASARILEEFAAEDDRIKVIHGACFPSETVARDDFEEKVQYYYKRWDTTLDEDNEVAALQQRGLSSPFARPGRFSHLEPLVPELAQWWINRTLPED